MSLTGWAVEAAFVQRRQDGLSTSPSLTSGSTSSSAPSLSRWVSSSDGRAISTVTPRFTTIDGQATTVDLSSPLASVTTSPTTTSRQSGTSTASSAIDLPTPPAGSFPKCENPVEPFVPFCLPEDGKEVWVGDTYYVTWDTAVILGNATVVKVLLNYANSSGGGSQAWESKEQPAALGYVSVQMDDAWRRDQPRNNLTFSMIELIKDATERSRSWGGPTISLIKKPASHYPPPPPTKVPNKLGLTVGLPVILGVIALILCGLCIGMRKTRKIGLGNIMGRRRGYGVGKSRRQRMRTARRAGPVRLGEDEIVSGPLSERDEGYRDHDLELSQRSPRTRGRPGRTEDLGDLVESPTDEGGFGDDEARGRGNAFRDEVRRQKTGRS
ncbi:MAG: hypothetical protein M1817_000412 [Caeruleum heppii]|nr:MAG: hypothetical protein M1817_000412 [Caeruleum heppii]